MYVIIWEYQVKEEYIAEFEKIYGEDGTWVELFKNGNGYLGTELFHDSVDRYHYITIDRWISSEAYNSFQATWQDEYKALNERCKSFMDGESFLGTFSSAQPGG